MHAEVARQALLGLGEGVDHADRAGRHAAGDQAADQCGGHVAAAEKAKGKGIEHGDPLGLEGNGLGLQGK
jgi:hypothetical protein